jgi:F-type H+-transporting ATPase subunit b
MTIDWWTLGFQFVNVAVLVWLLAHFFWKPVAAMIEARRAAAAKLIADAEASQAAARDAQAEIAATRAGFAAEHDRVLADARRAAEVLKARLAKEAQADADRIRADAMASAAERAKQAEKAWGERAADLAVAIAGKLLAPQDGRAVRARFLDGLVAQLNALPDAERGAATAPEAELTATTAAPLEADEEALARSRITQALGGSPRIAFATDPTLLSGLELAGPGFTVRNSWRADLDRIRDGLAHG